MTNTTATGERGLAYKWKVLISIIFGIFMIILDSTVVNVALQRLRGEFGVSLSQVQWVISAYVLALGIATPLSGYLADRFGIRRMYLSGLALFTLGSVLCGLAPSFELLVAARVLQGLGGGMAQPLGPALLYSTFPPSEQGTALGFFGIALVVAPALGPILGGALVQADLWRGIFFINLPIGLLGLFLAGRFLRERTAARPPRLDLLGALLSVVAFGALLYGASTAGSAGWGAPDVRAAFAIGALGMAAFVFVELFVAKEPLLELRLFRSARFSLASVLGWVTVMALFGAEFLMPLYQQVLRGRSALETGLLLLPLAVAAGIVTPIAGRIYDRVGPRPLVTLGFLLLLVNTWQLRQISALTPERDIALLLALRGTAFGLVVQTTFTTALGAVPIPLLQRGSALVNGMRSIVQAISVALLSTVLSGALSPATLQLQAQAQAIEPAGGTASFGLCETPGAPADQNLPPQARQAPPAARAQIEAGVAQACQEYLQGFRDTYTLTFGFALLALLLGLFMPGWPFGWAGRGVVAGKPVNQPAPGAAKGD